MSIYSMKSEKQKSLSMERKEKMSYESRYDTARNEGKAVARKLLDDMNCLSQGKAFIDGFVTEITSEHRTLQQGVGRLVVELLKAWSHAHEDSRFDARNQATVEFAAAAIAKFEEKDMHLPMI
jgi:hypothetical protein